MKQPFRVRLKKAHDQLGKTQYAVSKESGINKNTVSRYVESNEVFVAKVEPPLIQLIKFYGLDWHDPEVLEYIEDGE